MTSDRLRVLILGSTGSIGTQALEVIAANPAKLLGVQAGALRTGHEADIVLIDPDRPWQVDSGKMAAAAGNTPFDKLPVQGRCLALFKGGRLVDQRSG